ncbi:glycosyltransferase family 4 protein [Christiangramia aquimixticola]|uniref:glycosyltransferase family 4 protein n=1 Tax=Christiangramia aquimixticola TaxID=1697558 RepID=UPI003AA9294C
MPKLLIIGYVWPEPNSTAAGSRMMQLIEFFQAQQYEVTFATTAKETENMFDLESIGVQSIQIKLNDSSFDDFVSDLSPEIVIFDRFMTEEQFGWRVDKMCPDALKILDTEDLHFLRKAREQAYKTESDLTELVYTQDITKREIAAIYRCDISLIISEVEMDYLKAEFNIPDSILFYLPFMYADIKPVPAFGNRNGFISIGNFLHEPNWNTALFLKEKIWPELRKKLPAAKMNIYGAYPSQKVFNLHNEKQGFLVHGRAEDSKAVMEQARVCLAPIQFGAGLKGKLAEAMICGTPSVTSTIGSEGLNGDMEWNGSITNDIDEFVTAAFELYTNEDLWYEKQQMGSQIIKKRFNKDLHQERLKHKIEGIQSQLTEHRKMNFTGSLLKHHLHKSTYYMSKFIEEKNRK